MGGTGVLSAPPTAGWLFEYVGPVVWLVLAARFALESRRAGRVTRNTLLFIGATTMWWQEWYGDWASYLIYNPNFSLIPWGSTLWASPNKPWAVIPAYGWYYTLAFLVLYWLVDRVRASRPGLTPMKAAVLVGLPLFYLIDLAVEGGASVLGMWSYTQWVGPAMQSPGGNFPLLYPVLYFMAWCTLMGALTYATDEAGLTPLDRLLRIRRPAPAPSAPAGGGTVAVATRAPQVTVRQELVRVAAWVVGFNASYWFTFILPLVLLRQAFGPPSTLVP